VRSDAPARSEGGERKKFDRPERSARPPRQDKDERRPNRDRNERGGPDRNRGDRNRNDRGAPREWSSATDRRNEPDPNSPFAKLAALKAQLESGGKDR
jgi:ATP-dependent RNA helicase SUPV3L1/SUV3